VASDNDNAGEGAEAPAAKPMGAAEQLQRGMLAEGHAALAVMKAEAEAAGWSKEEFRKVTIGSLIMGPARALDLLKRVPALFKERRWPVTQDATAIAATAVGCVKLGAVGTRLRIPAELALAHPRWAECARLEDGKPTAAQVVVRLDLQRLLEP
jgi:hypothetical protein